MGKNLYSAIVVVASLVLVNSLTCNKCTYGLLGICLSNSEVECSTNTSVCFTGKTTFTSLTAVGFNTQDCREPEGCNTTMTGSLLGVGYQARLDCCSTDKCNPLTVSGAPTTRTTFALMGGAAVLASVWGSMM